MEQWHSNYKSMNVTLINGEIDRLSNPKWFIADREARLSYLTTELRLKQRPERDDEYKAPADEPV